MVFTYRTPSGVLPVLLAGGLCRQTLLNRSGPEGLLFALAKLLADPVALRAAALLVHELDIECRERNYINQKETA
jgi:hypothetical protein